MPGNFANIGNGDSAVCHSPHYDFNHDALIHGVRYFAALTRSRLAARARGSSGPLVQTMKLSSTKLPENSGENRLVVVSTKNQPLVVFS